MKELQFMHMNSVGCVRRGNCISHRFCEYCFDIITNKELIKKRVSPASFIIKNMPNITIYYPWIKLEEDRVPHFKPKSILSKWSGKKLEALFNIVFPKVLSVNEN
jgi:hypothetical protein